MLITMAEERINQIVIVDNGAHSIKVGLFSDINPKIIPNCVTKVKSERRRPFIGDQLEECKDYSGLFYILPFSKGYLINWEVQRQIWDYIFRTKLKLPTDSKNQFSKVGLIMTEPVFNFKPIRENMLELLFEDYGFGEILICSAPQLAAFKYLHEENSKSNNVSNIENYKKQKLNKEIACLVVDSGFSFSHVVPFIEGFRITTHMKRIDVGGKALTNHLKDIISYRQLNVLDETYVVSQMKEDCCFVSTDFWKDLEISSKKSNLNSIARDYVLPDYIAFKRGFVYDKEKHSKMITSDHQRIRMNNERFQVPELLFNPSDVNIDQIGISETIILSVSGFNPNFKHLESKDEEDDEDEVIEEAPVKPKKEKPVMKKVKEFESEEDEEIEDEEEEEEVMEDEPDENDEESSQDEEDDETEDASNYIDCIDEYLSKYNDENIQSHLYNNIILIGGNCCFPNFRDRIYNDVRCSVADILDVRVMLPDDPITYAWKGGQLLCTINEDGESVTDINQSLFCKYAISRETYDEIGLDQCADMTYQLGTNL